mmetsp:Transcript_35287/g.88008  ORF Transcript_35287/g.88008 Transcript_35287/m.88008 type:complete len:230 (-) Transcript_35287:479-1168(-)
MATAAQPRSTSSSGNGLRAPAGVREALEGLSRVVVAQQPEALDTLLLQALPHRDEVQTARLAACAHEGGSLLALREVPESGEHVEGVDAHLQRQVAALEVRRHGSELRARHPSGERLGARRGDEQAGHERRVGQVDVLDGEGVSEADVARVDRSVRSAQLAQGQLDEGPLVAAQRVGHLDRLAVERRPRALRVGELRLVARHRGIHVAVAVFEPVTQLVRAAGGHREHG